VNATIIQMPRSFYAMAEDGVLPRAFLRVNPDTQVQEVGLLFFGATMLIPAFLLGSFEKLLNYVIFTDTLTLAVVWSPGSRWRALSSWPPAGLYIGWGTDCSAAWPVMQACATSVC
jgi:amino acid transporter